MNEDVVYKKISVCTNKAPTATTAEVYNGLSSTNNVPHAHAFTACYRMKLCYKSMRILSKNRYKVGNM
jgi:hypothetical protein